MRSEGKEGLTATVVVAERWSGSRVTMMLSFFFAGRMLVELAPVLDHGDVGRRTARGHEHPLPLRRHWVPWIRAQRPAGGDDEAERGREAAGERRD
jgi:hypothetical protein